jgi:CO/xanthine dehydrogenase FAD-binding subunit
MDKSTKYVAPENVNDAVRLLEEHAGQVALVAGGTDIVPKINYYELAPGIIMSIGRLGLDYIRESNGTLIIGAGTSVAKISASELITEKACALAAAAASIGSPAIRTAATVGGNLVNGSPAADTATPLLVMDAQLKLVSDAGERTVPLADFFVGPGETVLKTNELLTEIIVPMPKGKTVFAKLGRRKGMTCSIVNVAVRLEIDRDKCLDARIAVGSMAPTPLRCRKAEALIKGRNIDSDVIKECSAAAIDETSPIDDERAAAWYRKQAGTAVLARALREASGQA